MGHLIFSCDLCPPLSGTRQPQCRTTQNRPFPSPLRHGMGNPVVFTTWCVLQIRIAKTLLRSTEMVDSPRLRVAPVHRLQEARSEMAHIYRFDRFEAGLLLRFEFVALENVARAAIAHVARCCVLLAQVLMPLSSACRYCYHLKEFSTELFRFLCVCLIVF